MKMKNGYLLGKIEEKEVSVLDSGFTVKNLDPFKTVEIVQSNSEEVKVGDLVRVSQNSGSVDELGLVLHESDIIYIL